MYLCVLLLLSLFAHYQPVVSDCEWKLEFVGFPNQFKYYSACNQDAYVIITMVALIEYTSGGIPVGNSVYFGTKGEAWDWTTSFGESSSYQGNECMVNKYIGKLGSIFKNNCTFNITTYLFDEIANLDIYNDSTSITLDPYTLKWDFDIADWPWIPVLPNDYLQLSMMVETNVGGVIDSDQDDYFQNVTFGGDFVLSLPKVMTCNGQIVNDIQIDINDNYLNEQVSVSIKLPRCVEHIFYDPIVYAIDNQASSTSDNGLSGGQTAGIVFGILFIVVIVGVGGYVYHKKKPAHSFTSEQNQ